MQQDRRLKLLNDDGRLLVIRSIIAESLPRKSLIARMLMTVKEIMECGTTSSLRDCLRWRCSAKFGTHVECAGSRRRRGHDMRSCYSIVPQNNGVRTLQGGFGECWTVDER